MRTAALVLLAVWAVMAATACGGADLSSVAQAAERTQEARTARVTMEARQDGSERIDRVDGAVDFAKRRIDFEIAGLGRFIIDGETMYVSAPEYIQKFTGGKSWLKDDLSREDDASMDLDVESLFDFFDPIRLLEVLRDGVEAEEVGSEEVRGVATTRYRGTIDVATFAAVFMPSTDVPADAADKVRVEVWIGRDDLLRRVTYDVPAIGDERGGTLEIEYHDMGKDLGITLPPEDDVADLDDVEEREDRS